MIRLILLISMLVCFTSQTDAAWKYGPLLEEGLYEVSGSGDVSATASFGTDNVLIKSDGTEKGVQATGISVADTTNNITGAGNYSGTGATFSGLTASEIVITDGSNNLASAAVATYPSLTELSYVKGVTSAIQTQLNGKQSTLTNPITGTGTSNEIAYFPTASTVGSLAVAIYPSLTELTYVKGVTSAIQTQLNAKGVGTVTSVGATVPAGLTISGSPVTTTGTLAIGLDTDRVIPTQTQLDAKAPLVSPSFTTPSLGVATATSINGATITSGTLNGSVTGSNTGDQTTITGNAGTATALAANGANCSAGSYPLGVNASGAAEGCTDATTEINSAIATHAALTATHGATGAVVGTTNTQTLTNKTLTSPKINEDVAVTSTATELNLLDGITVLSGSNTGDEPTATTSAEGVVELAIVSEVDTGTDTTRAITADALAGSNLGEKAVSIQVLAGAAAATVADGHAYLLIPSSVAGMNLVEVVATVVIAGTTGTMDIQLHNVTSAADILSTKITIDTAETSSSTAATPAVISGTEDDVAANDVIRVDIDVIHTTPAAGLMITLVFRLP